MHCLIGRRNREGPLNVGPGNHAQLTLDRCRADITRVPFSVASADVNQAAEYLSDVFEKEEGGCPKATRNGAVHANGLRSMPGSVIEATADLAFATSECLQPGSRAG